MIEKNIDGWQVNINTQQTYIGGYAMNQKPYHEYVNIEGETQEERNEFVENYIAGLREKFKDTPEDLPEICFCTHTTDLPDGGETKQPSMWVIYGGRETTDLIVRYFFQDCGLRKIRILSLNPRKTRFLSLVSEWRVKETTKNKGKKVEILSVKESFKHRVTQTWGILIKQDVEKIEGAIKKIKEIVKEAGRTLNLADEIMVQHEKALSEKIKRMPPEEKEKYQQAKNKKEEAELSEYEYAWTPKQKELVKQFLRNGEEEDGKLILIAILMQWMIKRRLFPAAVVKNLFPDHGSLWEIYNYQIKSVIMNAKKLIKKLEPLQTLTPQEEYEQEEATEKARALMEKGEMTSASL